MDCLVYLLGLVCFSTRGNQQEKEFLVKAMKREGFQISLQIFCTALHKVSSKLLLKSTPLKGSFLPWQQYNGLLWGLHSPGLSVGCILAEITIEKWHPCSLGEPCNIVLNPMDTVAQKATRTGRILTSRAFPRRWKAEQWLLHSASVALENQRLEHTAHRSSASSLKGKNLVTWLEKPSYF